jgi:hypothetical protein
MATTKWYGLGAKALANKDLDWDTDTIKVMLTTSAYTPNQDTHEFKSDVTNEVTGTGYTAGGATLANKVLSYDAGSNEVRLDADDTTWANSTITARYAVVYTDTGTAGTSRLWGYVDFVTDQSTSGTEFKITWASSGVLKGVVS